MDALNANETISNTWSSSWSYFKVILFNMFTWVTLETSGCLNKTRGQELMDNSSGSPLTPVYRHTCSHMHRRHGGSACLRSESGAVHRPIIPLSHTPCAGPTSLWRTGRGACGRRAERLWRSAASSALPPAWGQTPAPCPPCSEGCSGSAPPGPWCSAPSPNEPKNGKKGRFPLSFGAMKDLLRRR